MSIMNRPRIAAIALSGAAFTTLSPAALAQRDRATPSIDCSRSAACISQVGDGNTATIDQRGTSGNRATVQQSNGDGNTARVVLRGNGNGNGSIAGRSVGGLQIIGDGSRAVSSQALTVPALDGGSVRQVGSGNTAIIAVRGDTNQFHVSQHGSGNTATQLIGGTRDTAAAIQSGSGNTLSQVQLGRENLAYGAQAGSNNRAAQVQVGTVEALLLGAGTIPVATAAVFAAGTGTARGNSILLEQNGSGNEADLTQIGSNHSIALRQQGNAEIAITQVGNGRQIAVEQAASSRGITIVQGGLSR